ncbi:glycosyltransferase family A protein [Allorhodopirellula solitaria]|uniref:Poly-beta-1,6-N-acetyl-D-glucosamine synthase n=1 Tax=Allorhodopirellula solitaria TaxID=2527987 RepID=A0A5C5WZX2_9BACT|nr:glycosyltransferase family A protein [Allorhodopirellula solitaria]TWT55859.1 Poly-beta-1,6-N-acetyl-D-glucosamine synthase [Allorhodopirellula solitaria]
MAAESGAKKGVVMCSPVNHRIANCEYGEVLVSIILPCFNSDPYVSEAIDSALHQSINGIEVIAVDDGSTDRTAEILESYSAIHTHRFSQNKGKSSALNWAIERAKGQYILILDSDDVLEKECCKTLSAFLEANPDIGVAFGHARLFCDGSVLSERHPITEGVKKISFESRGDWQVLDSDAFFDATLNRSLCAMPSTMVRKSSYDAVGLHNEAVPSGQDWEMLVRLSEKYRFAFCDQVLSSIRRHDNNLSSSDAHLYARLRGRCNALEGILEQVHISDSQRTCLSNRLLAGRLHLARVLVADGECREARKLYRTIADSHLVSPPMKWRIMAQFPGGVIKAIQKSRRFFKRSVC